MDDKKKKRYLAMGLVAVVAFTGLAASAMMRHSAAVRARAQADRLLAEAQRDSALAKALKSALEKAALRDSLHGTLRDTSGVAMPGVVVSDGFTCVATDSAGRFALHRNPKAKFVYYTVPADCAVPTHSDTDRTAMFYQPIRRDRKNYDFVLTRLPGGKETNHRMIVIGDPQVTNTMNPYYTGPDDNPVEKSDVARFTDETMADIRETIDSWPEDTPVYGLSMGDDVQYYGGYNDSLAYSIRKALGSSRMTLFSVIGNHDQEGKRIYKEKWEENWGPTDYSFDRGDVHYVCFNNCDFYHGALYYSPGELSDEQMTWLTQDLALVDSTKKVVLCYHIPMTFGNRPGKKAEPLGIDTEKGHFASSRLESLLGLLQRFEGGFELFCGHTHFALNHEIDYRDWHIMERCHAAACGTIWQSNINICGTPNGYYVYTLNANTLADCYYQGTRWARERQMTLFRADSHFNKERYTEDWNLPQGKGILVANVFNADSRWQVMAIENGTEYPMTRLSGTGQDAFASGYHDRYAKAMSHWFVSKQNTYLMMNHLYYYVPKSPNAFITVKVTDAYGNTYTENTRNIIGEPYYNFAHYYSQR